MMSVSHRALVGLITLISLFLPHTVLVPSAEAQANGQRRGLASIFKNSKPKPKPEQPARPAVPTAIPTDRKAASLKGILMQALPGRHYKELLADAIVLAYYKRGYKPLWNYRKMPSGFQRSISEQLIRHGIPSSMALNPVSFGSAIKRSPVNSKDLGYTIAIADAGALVRLGAVAPETIWPDWDKGDRPGSSRNSATALSEDVLRIASSRSFNPGAAVDSMASRNWIYRELQNGFVASFREVNSPMKLPAIPNPSTGGVAKPDQPYPHAPALAEKLAAKGYLDLPVQQRRSLQSVTPELAAGIRRFQAANGLVADGIMGSGTWGHLNADPAPKMRKRAVNLHRARLLPDEFGKRYLLINLPSAELYAFEDGAHAFTMRVVHGKNEAPEFYTPVFRDVMREVVFAPYWNVPESISMKEIYPKLVEDPTYLDVRHYEIVKNFNDNTEVLELNEETMPKIESGKLWLRQRPTAGNALGKVKFLLPNQFHVYLHDTPSKQYFAMDNRAQSHGCIRLADPPKMAEWTLRKQGWEPERITEAMDAPTQSREALKESINVYVTYFTSFPRPVDTSAGDFILAPARDVYKMDVKDTETLAGLLP